MFRCVGHTPSAVSHVLTRREVWIEVMIKRCLSKVCGIVPTTKAVFSESLEICVLQAPLWTMLYTVKKELALQLFTVQEERAQRLVTEGLVREVTEHEQLVYGTRALDRDPAKDDTV